jgi:hypothetical protein
MNAHTASAGWRILSARCRTNHIYLRRSGPDATKFEPQLDKFEPNADIKRLSQTPQIRRIAGNDDVAPDRSAHDDGGINDV